MGGRNCCVPNCRRKSHDHRRRKIPNGLTFHCFPAWRRNEGGQISELTRRRRAAWVAAVGRSDITFNHIPTSMRVCSRHFHSGKPAYEMLESDPDWVPSLHLGPRDGTSRYTERRLLSEQRDQKRRRTPETGPSPVSRTAQREPEGGMPPYEMLESSSDWVPSLHLGSSDGISGPAERLLLSEQRDRDQKRRRTPETGPSPVSRTAQRGPEGAGPSRPAVRPWREVKSLLQSVLLPRDETGEQPPAAKKMDLSFRDFFRDALEASLEACSRSGTPSARQTSVSGDYEVELNFNLPPVKEENQTCDSSSSGCLNCVGLQRTIVELQDKLSRLTGEQDSMESPLRPDQVLESPETGHTEEMETAYSLECDQAESPALVPDECGSEDSLECEVESPAAVVTDEFENEGEGAEEDSSGSPGTSRKKGDPETWDENVQAGRGMMQNQEPKQMGMRCQSAACQKSIKLRCNEVEESKREEIFKYFWRELDWKERKAFVKSLVEVSSVKRRRTGAEESRRSASNSCHLLVDGRRIRVCQSMFLSTLGINQWSFLKWVGKRGKNAETASDRDRVRSDQQDFLKTFLLDLPKVSSHPCKSCSSEILDPVFKSIRRLHVEYKRCCDEHGIQPLSRQVFTSMFKDLNLSLFRQRKVRRLLET